jgi:hypothetical protein
MLSSLSSLAAKPLEDHLSILQRAQFWLTNILILQVHCFEARMQVVNYLHSWSNILVVIRVEVWQGTTQWERMQ